MGKDQNPRLPRSKTFADAGAGQRGRILDKPVSKRPWEICIVENYCPETQTYEVRGGSNSLMGKVPRLVADAGEVGILARGTQVVVHYEINDRPHIHAVVKGSVTNATEVNPARISEIPGVGGEDGSYAKSNRTSNMRPPNDPVDVLGDDWARKSQQNNFMGVLAGGSNVMTSSPMAQVRTHGVNNMVEVIANVYRHISALGNFEIDNNGGKTSLVWRGGADQLTENGANTENWTLRLDAGAEGDLFRLSVTTPNNNTLTEVHMSADGRLSLTGVAGVDISSGSRGTMREDVAENKEVSVLGKMSTQVNGKVTETFNANRETLVAADETHSTGWDLKETVGHDRLTHVSNKLHTAVDGGLPVPGNVAILWDAANGSIESVTGQTGVPTAQQSQNFVNYAGSFNFAVQPTAPMGKFTVISNMPDSVLLGASGSAVPLPGSTGHTFVPIVTDNVLKYMPFQALITALTTWMDSHIHLSAVGPSSPPVIPVSPIAAPMIPLVKSVRVMVGL